MQVRQAPSGGRTWKRRLRGGGCRVRVSSTCGGGTAAAAFAGSASVCGSSAKGLLFGYPDQWIRTLAGRLARVHLKDFRRAVGTLAGFVPLGDGDADWPAVIAALRAVGYDGWVTPETEPVRALPDGGVRDLAQRIDGLLAL
jgi:hypothetical protein